MSKDIISIEKVYEKSFHPDPDDNIETNQNRRNHDNVNETQQTNDTEFKYEKALNLIGFGAFQWFLSIVCILANASDAIEILCISFVLPSAECDLDLSTTDKGYLSSVTFAGMMVGGYFWGTLADVSGRKKILIQALLFNALFAILSGFSRSLVILLVFRFLSGIGVGGSIPVVWAYFSEFIPKHIRGRMLCCLASGWLLGNLLVILLAYLILNTNFQLSWLDDFLVINNWRLFMMACAVPSIITALLLFLLPESPKFCLYNDKTSEAKEILQKIYNINHRKQSHELKRIAYDHFNTFRYVKASLSDEDDDVRFDRDLNIRSKFSKIGYIFAYFKNSTVDIVKKTGFLFFKPYTFNTIIILYVMFALCFSYYGLWMWLPELYKRMEANGGSPCTVEHGGNSSIVSNRTCHIEDNIYLSSFISSLSNLPGNLFTIFFIDKMGRNIITSLSLIASGLSVLGIPFIHSESEGIILTTIFGGINVLTFNSFGCTALELYPTKLRSSAMGVQYVAGRLGAILGNLLFGIAVDLSCYIPLLTIVVLLISSGLASFMLPESKKLDIH